MVAIKDMAMPKGCISTQEILGDIGVVNCPLYNVCKHRDTINVNCKPTNCPLVEIGTCRDCVIKKLDKSESAEVGTEKYFCPIVSRYVDETPSFYCADFEKAR